ncbi:MAG: EAL domain-containing protein, partial [Synechococcaceae cyanobacterium RL_1_2]|nr:EAL domain-containing protein [Synechococcaceae cyanobacterium RL_1_2]
NSLDDIVWAISTESKELLYANPAVERISGYPLEDLLHDKQLWIDVVHPDDRPQVNIVSENLAKHNISKDLEYRIIRSDGSIRWLRDRARVIYDDQGKAIRIDGIATDITDRKRMEDKLIHDALHDNLTGLPNRTLFMDRLNQSIKRIKRKESYGFAVLFMDLDNFKVVNDSLGHIVGDELLISIAHTIQQSIRPVDTVARLGGDEFTVLIEDIKNDDEAIAIASRINEELTSPLYIQGQEIFTSTSVGIAFSSPNYKDADEILRDADIAMYQAKDAGKSRYAVFKQTMHDETLRRVDMESSLRRAIINQEFVVYYQPIIALTQGTISGFEALIRWQHPSKGMISPQEFIPIAEETGLIVQIGAWVLEESCRQINHWHESIAHTTDLTMSINLSSRQLKKNSIIEQIDDILNSTGVNKHRIKLEITESLLMQNIETATQLLEAMRAMGLKLSLDDFGTGYSSLSYLHRFPLNTLKVDRSFVSRIGVNGENSAIVNAIVTLAHSMEMDIVAEGIETKEQMDYLRKLGCEYGQGYYFSAPVDGHKAEQLLLEQKNWLD